ncbi:LysR family transcriptional regulator [Chromobacterium phragmitis]|nr:LysR family transcriptional regulator [Chromobacterium phragmitis]
MNLRNLRYFVAVARHGSYQKAAARIHLTQPALSKAIQQLEEELDATLLVRSRPGSPASLTPAGELVLRRAESLLRENAAMLDDLARLKCQTQGELRLGLPPLAGIPRVARLMQTFRSLYPLVQLRLFESGGCEQEDAVMSGDIEVAICLTPQHPELDSLLIGEYPLRFVLPASHPLAGRASLKPAEVADMPWIRLEGASQVNRMAADAWQQAGLVPETYADSGHLGLCLSLVAAGCGLLILPEPWLPPHPTDIALVPCDDPSLTWKLSLIWRRGIALSEPAERWRQLLIEEGKARDCPPGVEEDAAKEDN